MSSARGHRVYRTQNGKSTWRWEVKSLFWEGRSSFVSIEGLEVVVGERFGENGTEQTFSCRPGDFLEGCFQGSVREAFGAAILEEILDEVKRRKRFFKPRERLEMPEDSWGPVPGPAIGLPEESEEEGVQVTPPAPGDKEVGLALLGASRVDMTLIVALKSMTKEPVGELLGRLKRMPATLLAKMERSHAQKCKDRLDALGARSALTAT